AIALGVTAFVALFLGCLIFSVQKKKKIMSTLHNITVPNLGSSFSRGGVLPASENASCSLSKEVGAQ
ncbi:hypothetical protein DNTS_033050, partial [Danionella cerebrum]